MALILLASGFALACIAVVARMLLRPVAQAPGNSQDAELVRQEAVETSAQLKIALEDMRQARDRAEGADRSKNNLLLVASHDLRQPVHALGLYMAALRAEARGPARTEIVDRMSRSVVSLQGMLNQLLDMSRIDAGAITPDVRPFALQPMLHRLAEEFAAEANARGLRLSVRASAAAKRLNALGDPLLVERIIRNLVDNAVKYTSQGGVLIACRLTGGPGGLWRVEIWDTGPGIPAADQERIFEEFFRVSGPERGRSDGMGLGLSIVRRLARLLQHRVRVDSLSGRGSRFVLELPATEGAARSDAPPRVVGTLEGLGVGVIEQDPDVRAATRILLEGWGCVVTEGADAAELLARAGDRHPERLQLLIVDDPSCHGSSGMDAIAAVRRARGITQPALIVTGGSASQRIRDLEATGLQWMMKPVEPERLHRWLAVASRFRYHCLFEDDLLTRSEAAAALREADDAAWDEGPDR